MENSNLVTRAVEYSHVYKLTRAALELRRTGKTVLEIALDFGYSNPENFARAFKGFYGTSPSEYRAKYSGEAVTWHDLSGRIGISRFKNAFPELKQVSVDTALDYMFTHDIAMYAEDIVGITVTQAAAFTLGDPDAPEHFVYVADYNRAQGAVHLVCADEDAAVEYLSLLSRTGELILNIRREPDAPWERFDAGASALGLVCQYGYDMIYSERSVDIPSYDGLAVRELGPGDMPLVAEFKRRGGCAECHVRGLQAHFDGSANAGERGFGLFADGELVCLATPCLDVVRDLKKYDIGAIFAIGAGARREAVELIWKYVVGVCLREGCLIGNANALEDASPLGVAESERVGLVRTAKYCGYAREKR